MKFLVAFSVIHKAGQFVSSAILETSLLHAEDVAQRHIENWETIKIPAFYKAFEKVSIRVLCFQPIKD